MMDSSTSREDLLQSLKRQLRQFSRTEPAVLDRPDVVSLGLQELDDLLPAKGMPPGGIVEWLTPGEGAGAATLALAGVRAALAHNTTGCWVVIDERGEFFPPAALGWGISADRLLLVRPGTARDAAWAFEQALRCPGVAITWNWVNRAHERALQRWKVAAEAGGGQGVLFRSDQALRQASWADVRWLVKPVTGGRENGRRLHLELAYCRGVISGAQIELECDDEKGLVRMVPQLADSTSRRRSSRAS